MKKTYISNIKQFLIGTEVHILGWIAVKRCHSSVLFMDIQDSTGTIQVLFEKESYPLLYCQAKKLHAEAAVKITGRVQLDRNKSVEIVAREIVLIGDSTISVDPHPRDKTIDIFDENLTSHLLDYRHLYLRNPKIMAILKFRDFIMHEMREWFYQNGFTSIDTPILTPVPLYEDKSALSVNVHGQDVFMTQCAGYYLEAAVHAFEKVYNLGPSFRNEESRSKRHLMEYWHIKAEMAWDDLEGVIGTVEHIIQFLTQRSSDRAQEIFKTLGTTLCTDGLKIPFPHISYGDAIQLLTKHGMDINYGKSFGSIEEEELSKYFEGPFWITGIPRTIEPFPYVIDSQNPKVTMVADLIASNGYGELLGVAEKIHSIEMLDERMADKGRRNDPRFNFVREVHQMGCVPHVAFGMGLERLIRWLLNVPHVRDAIPFPRIFKRTINP